MGIGDIKELGELRYFLGNRSGENRKIQLESFFPDMVVSTTPTPVSVLETPELLDGQTLMEEDPGDPAQMEEAPTPAKVTLVVVEGTVLAPPSPVVRNQVAIAALPNPPAGIPEEQKLHETMRLEAAKITEKSWKAIVSAEEDERLVLASEFLAGKITISHNQDIDADPAITIVPEVLEVLASAWKTCLVIKALGTIIPLEILQRKLKELWKPAGKMRVIDLPNGYHIIKFSEERDYMGVLTGGPWTVFGHYVVIKPWTPNFDPRTDVVLTTPAWIRLTDLPVILYEEKVLLKLASAVGNPLKVDQKTLNANRGRFARICVELDLTKPLKGAIPSCPQDPKNVAKRLEVETLQAAAVVTGKHSVAKAWGSWMHPTRRGRTKSENVRTAPNPTYRPAKTGGHSVSKGCFAALAVDDDDMADPKDGGWQVKTGLLGMTGESWCRKKEEMGKEKTEKRRRQL
ncbi:hypothetical protein V2J09_019511 [Rumex salicifolius]